MNGTNSSLPQQKKSVTSGQSQLVVNSGRHRSHRYGGGIPNYCVGEDVPYIWVPSKADLGIACGIKKGAMAASINSSDSSPIAPQVRQLQQKIEQRWGP
jgi:ribosomal protein L7Ae-like RNA K-turn-binding protein